MQARLLSSGGKSELPKLRAGSVKSRCARSGTSDDDPGRPLIMANDVGPDLAELLGGERGIWVKGVWGQ